MRYLIFLSRLWPIQLAGYIWALPNTLIGLALMLYYGSYGWRWHDGALWVQHKRIIPKWAAGQTWGWLVYGEGFTGGRFERHELAHVRQQLVLGPLFLLAYPLASVVARVRGGEWYRDNWFEQQARRVSFTSKAALERRMKREKL
jgi:hypothetical protein